MQTGWLLVFLCTAAFLASADADQTVSPQQIDAIFTELKSGNAPGGAVLVLQNGREIIKRGYGVADLRSGRKINPETNFRLQ